MLTECLADLLGGTSPPHDVVLTGPRGTGTVLINWFELDLEVGRTLLNASQQVRVDAPFLLVLAGTPGLAAHLGTMDVSF